MHKHTRESKYADAKVIDLGPIPENARLVPAKGEVVADLIAELGGRRPTKDRVYMWINHGFVVRRRSGAPRVRLPVVYRASQPMTSLPMVRAWWRRVKAESKKWGMVPRV